MFLKTSEYSQETTALEYLFNKVAGLNPIQEGPLMGRGQKGPPHSVTHIPQ